MGSSTNGKKHKKDKKHKHRSRTTSEEDVAFDLTGEGEDSSNAHRHHRHKKHREHKDRHKHKHPERERERRSEVIAVEESDSDSSDCVEVPLGSEKEQIAPPPPQITRHSDVEREGRDREREKERERDREREREREKEKLRERERERERNERERNERERDRERERERDYDRSRDPREKDRERDRDRERERERYERQREPERRRDRDQERDRADRDRERDREQHHHHRERMDRDRERMPEQTRGHSPIPENGAGDCLSIEETNKLRAKLGLKPLEVESGPIKSTNANAANDSKTSSTNKDLSSYKDEWGEFLHKPAENLKEKAQAEKFRDKLKQRKEKRFLEERLARIRTLGESDEEVDDTSKWVERNKRVQDQKKDAEKREKALEEMDAEFGVDDLVEKQKEEARRKAYNDKHLKGLRVEHDMEEFSEGRTVILTLKDKNVLDEEDGDTLVNVNMVDDERYRKNVENKKLNPLSYGYNVYEEQYDLLGNPIERNILEKYDEDVDGNKKKKNFVIGENLDEAREHQRKLQEIKTKLAGKRLETLADVKIQLASDTFSEAELAKFKKPKKKVKRLRQKLKAEDLLPLNDEPVERHLGRRNRHTEVEEDVSVDFKDGMQKVKVEEEEDDLHQVLSKARKLKQKENLIKKSLPVEVEEIKQEIKIESPETSNSDGRAAEGNIILNSTAEFCRTLGDIPTYGMAGNRNEDSNDMMDFEQIEGSDERIAGIHGDEEPELNYGTWNSVNPDDIIRPMELEEIRDDVEDVAILDEEPDVGAGVANALRLALSKGYLEKEEHNRPSNSKMAHLQAKNYSIEDKTTGDDDKFGRRDRFHSGPIMEFRDKDNFKPNVKLEYIDDNGRILNLKEAFRYLSHKFHGKGPGKNKIEKRLKKMEQEGLMKTMSSTDTPLGTLTMLQQKQKETKTPFVVLSGGKQTGSGMNSSTLSKYK